MDYIKRIQIDPKVMMGKPVIVGTRIPVHLVLDLLAQGYTVERLLKAYPALKKNDVTAALAFAARRFDREETYIHA
ncbi:MAG: hypothetical protein G01um101416_885 [Microgenomates group bacterium Gr01-1014_16]|nr:MAG: hypothetical protein G01um101416_885 [Microgenomates group bacterium Gr01-1014_16]